MQNASGKNITLKQESAIKYASNLVKYVSRGSLLQACQQTQEDLQHFPESEDTISGKTMSLTMMHILLPTER